MAAGENDALSAEDAFIHAPQPEPDDELRYGADVDHVIDAFRPPAPVEGRLGVIVLIHGGFWRPAYDRGHLRRAARALTDEGWTVANVEYRRIPGDPDATIADVERAVAFARAEFPDGPLLLVGHSAGGHLALLTAGRRPDLVDGVVPVAAASDLIESERLELGGGAAAAFLGGPAAARADLDPGRLPIPDAPIRLVHGAADPTVPISLSRGYAARDDRIVLTVLDGVDHVAPMDPDTAAWPTTVAAIRAVAESCS